MQSPDGNAFMCFVPSLNMMDGNSEHNARENGPEKESALRDLTILIDRFSGGPKVQFSVAAVVSGSINTRYFPAA